MWWLIRLADKVNWLLWRKRLNKRREMRILKEAAIIVQKQINDGTLKVNNAVQKDK